MIDFRRLLPSFIYFLSSSFRLFFIFRSFLFLFFFLAFFSFLFYTLLFFFPSFFFCNLHSFLQFFLFLILLSSFHFFLWFLTSPFPGFVHSFFVSVFLIALSIRYKNNSDNISYFNNCIFSTRVYRLNCFVRTFISKTPKIRLSRTVRKHRTANINFCLILLLRPPWLKY